MILIKGKPGQEITKELWLNGELIESEKMSYNEYKRRFLSKGALRKMIKK